MRHLVSVLGLAVLCFTVLGPSTAEAARPRATFSAHHDHSDGWTAGHTSFKFRKGTVFQAGLELGFMNDMFIPSFTLTAAHWRALQGDSEYGGFAAIGSTGFGGRLALAVFLMPERFPVRPFVSFATEMSSGTPYLNFNLVPELGVRIFRSSSVQLQLTVAVSNPVADAGVLSWRLGGGILIPFPEPTAAR